MKKFILFRHGETDLNAKKIFQGCGVDADLNENGRQQALELKEVLKPYKIQCVYTSPLKRAVSTASLAFDETNAHYQGRKSARSLFGRSRRDASKRGDC